MITYGLYCKKKEHWIEIQAETSWDLLPPDTDLGEVLSQLWPRAPCLAKDGAERDAHGPFRCKVQFASVVKAQPKHCFHSCSFPWQQGTTKSSQNSQSLTLILPVWRNSNAYNLPIEPIFCPDLGLPEFSACSLQTGRSCEANMGLPHTQQDIQHPSFIFKQAVFLLSRVQLFVTPWTIAC